MASESKSEPSAGTITNQQIKNGQHNASTIQFSSQADQKDENQDGGFIEKPLQTNSTKESENKNCLKTMSKDSSDEILTENENKEKIKYAQPKTSTTELFLATDPKLLDNEKTESSLTGKTLETSKTKNRKKEQMTQESKQKIINAIASENEIKVESENAPQQPFTSKFTTQTKKTLKKEEKFECNFSNSNLKTRGTKEKEIRLNIETLITENSDVITLPHRQLIENI